MTNPYYNGGAFPATGAPATSASMRAELSSISSGFDKLPTLSGNASKLVVVNSSASALEAVSVLPSLTITDTNLVVEDNADSTRKFRFEASGITAGATRILTVPDANLTLVGTDTVQTLTNKTFNLTNNLFTATSAQLAAAVTDETGSGALVFATSPVLTTPNLGTPSALTLTNATGLPVATGISGLGTGVATALAVNTGTAGAFVVNGGALGTPSSGTVTNLTGTASININGTVGATTPAAGAFTTLSASSTVSGTGFTNLFASPPAIGGTAANTGAFTTLSASSSVTLSGGTANGVLYLNGSKVATSGSALTFDGTNLSASLGLKAASAGTVVSSFVDGLSVGGYESIGFLASPGNALAVGGYRAAQWSAVEFYASGSLQATLTSTGLGIGTSSPTQKLEVAGSVLLNPTNPALAFNTLAYQVYKQGTSLRLYANSIDHLVCDGTGNVGIGTSSPTNRLTVAAPNAKQNVVSTTGTNEVILFLQNTGGDFYIGRENSAGTYFSAPAYSANLVSAGAYPMLFWTNSTERMRLDSSGNLGLGVTPSAWSIRALQVGSGFAAWSTAVTNARIFGNTYYDGAYKYVGTGRATQYEQDGYHAWYTAPSGTAGNAISFTQAMTLDASGRLGIGVTNPSVGLVVAYGTDGIIGNYYSSAGNNSRISFSNQSLLNNNVSIGSASDAMVMYTNSTERARITSGGSFQIGSSSASDPRLFVYDNDSTDAAIVVRQDGAAPIEIWQGSGAAERARITSGGNLLVGTTTDSGQSDRVHVSGTIGITSSAIPQINFYSANANIDFVNRDSGGAKTFNWYYAASGGGTPATLSSSGVWTNASDARGKANISDIHYGLSTALALKPRQYDVKSDNSHAIGFVAQEVLPIIPEVVHGTDDKGYGLDYGSIVAVLTKAIQEQQALINALTARVAALEAQP